MELTPNEAVEAVEAVPGVFLTKLLDGEKTSMQHFFIEPGAKVPEHRHPHEQTGVIIEGSLTFVIDGEEYRAQPGDSFLIPGDEPHAAENRTEEPVKGVDVFSPPRTNPDWEQD